MLGGIDDGAARVEVARRHVRGAREDVGVGTAEVRREEPPRALDLVVDLVVADVTAPDHVRAAREQRRHHAGRLRIVHDDHVVGPHHRRELGQVDRASTRS